MIPDFINTLCNNISYDKVLLKELSRFGAIRKSDQKLVDEAIQQNLRAYDVWMAESGGQRYYMATYDAGNIVYASWYANVIGEENLQTTNVNNLGDMVEAGLGFLYLASTFPRHMQHLMRDPNWMWRRIETSLTSKRSWKTTVRFGKRRSQNLG